MKLQEICQQTGLSKKTIYFYIKEGFIHPAKDDQSGYYSFRKKDCQTLQVIYLLRQTGMSIDDIHDLFLYPTYTNFFLHRQVHIQREKIQKEIESLQICNQLFESIPSNVRVENLNQYPISIQTGTINYEDLLKDDDPSMLAIILWGPFLDIKETSYKQFLWKSISKQVRLYFNHHYNCLHHFIYQCSSKNIDWFENYQYQLMNRIANLTDTDWIEDLLIQKIDAFVQDSSLQEIYQIEYDSLILPSSEFYSAKTSNLMKQYNPHYAEVMKMLQKVIDNSNKSLLWEKSVS